MIKCIMKKNWTCSAGALELTLASFYIRQFMRLIVHFYSELTLNHHQVFVITSFCDHIHFGRPRYIIKVAQNNRNPRLCHFSHDCIFKMPNCGGKKPRPWQHWFAVPFSHMSIISLAHCLALSLDTLALSRALSLSLSLSLSLLSHTLTRSLSLSPRSLHFRLAGRLIITQSKITNITQNLGWIVCTLGRRQ